MLACLPLPSCRVYRLFRSQSTCTMHIRLATRVPFELNWHCTSQVNATHSLSSNRRERERRAVTVRLAICCLRSGANTAHNTFSRIKIHLEREEVNERESNIHTRIGVCFAYGYGHAWFMLRILFYILFDTYWISNHAVCLHVDFGRLFLKPSPQNPHVRFVNASNRRRSKIEFLYFGQQLTRAIIRFALRTALIES